MHPVFVISVIWPEKQQIVTPSKLRMDNLPGLFGDKVALEA